MSDAPRPPFRQPTFEQIVQERYSRRQFLKHSALAGIAVAAASMVPMRSFAETAISETAAVSGLTFTEIPKSNLHTHMVAPGYDTQLVIRWGDKLMADAPEFNPAQLTADAQLKQFGYNNDFLAFIPFPIGSNSSDHGLLCANHEYTDTYLMFPGMTRDNARDLSTKEMADTELAAHGHSVVEIRREGNVWVPVVGSPLNRRYTPHSTKMTLTGPAAGHDRMKTSEDPEGTTVIGTFANCAGGVTPWHSVLFCEENFDYYFAGNPDKTEEKDSLRRYGVGDETWYGWSRYYDRFHVEKEPHEPNRFGWVIEYDPYNPSRTPVKRTALGRFKHETATPALAPDGRVVVYSGDDEVFEYLYRFVSNGTYDANDRSKNFGLLDDGTLYAAQFDASGKITWLPLVYGQGPLTEQNGFKSQGDVLIETRRAADLVGATPMDRPEGIAVHPTSAHVFVSLTNNKSREESQINAPNTRAHNKHGQILEMMPPKGNHAADIFEWKIFLQGGNPAIPEDGARYGGPVSEHGWLSCPDNLAMDPKGNLWIACDGQPKSIGYNDSVYATATKGPEAGRPKHFFTGPVGCEATGPCFTPDGTTLFVSVQHPGEGEESSFDNPTTRWPDFRGNTPPRPSVVAITKKDGGVVGS